VPTAAWSASIVSFLPDGRDLKVEVTGIRAPVGLAFDPQTGDLLATMNQRDDLGSVTPGDFLSVVRSGQAWHFPSCYGQGGAACSGVPQATAVLDKHAAVSDVSVVGRSALVAEWAVGKVVRVALPSGAVSAFLTGVKNPVAVALGPDGGLYVGDWSTGTVYRVTGANSVA
jgi:glucose/arabinose dehydrogenase